MLGSNKDGIIDVDLAVINSIKIYRILCIGSTTAKGKLRVYFSKNSANRKFSCNSCKNSLFLLVGKLLTQESKKSLLSEDELLQNSSEVYCTSGKVNMYILVDIDNIHDFLKEVYYKVLRKDQRIFDNLATYGVCVLARVVRNRLLGHDSFDEYSALKSVKNKLLANAEYRSYDLEEENIIKEKALQNYGIFSRTINRIDGITIQQVKCIGNTEPGEHRLRVYLTKNRKDQVLAYGTSLFVFRCKVPLNVVKNNVTLNEILLGLKSRSIISRKNPGLSFIVFLLVFEDKLCKFLHEVCIQSERCDVDDLRQYGKVVLAYPSKSSTPLKKNCLLWDLKILKELGILDSLTKSRLVILGENKVANHSPFNSFYEEETTHGSSGAPFSMLKERVSTLFNNVKSSRIGYRNVNHQ
ncbi:DUF3023 domain-containing protein [Ehrlichia sp. JZT12]